MTFCLPGLNLHIRILYHLQIYMEMGMQITTSCMHGEIYLIVAYFLYATQWWSSNFVNSWKYDKEAKGKTSNKFRLTLRTWKSRYFWMVNGFDNATHQLFYQKLGHTIILRLVLSTKWASWQVPMKRCWQFYLPLATHAQDIDNRIVRKHRE